jgi:hypothetical protein
MSAIEQDSGLAVLTPSFRYNSSPTKLPLANLCWYEVKGGATLIYVTAACGENAGKVPPFLNLGKRRRPAFDFRPQSLTPRKDSMVPTAIRCVGHRVGLDRLYKRRGSTISDSQLYD